MLSGHVDDLAVRALLPDRGPCVPDEFARDVLPDRKPTMAMPSSAGHGYGIHAAAASGRVAPPLQPTTRWQAASQGPSTLPDALLYETRPVDDRVADPITSATISINEPSAV